MCVKVELLSSAFQSVNGNNFIKIRRDTGELEAALSASSGEQVFAVGVLRHLLHSQRRIR